MEFLLTLVENLFLSCDSKR